jgi:DNA-binding transcriptional LysR family regulator
MDSNETIKQAVIAGLGIAFISGHTIEQECQAGRIVILDVVETPIRRQWFRSGTPAVRPPRHCRRSTISSGFAVPACCRF